MRKIISLQGNHLMKVRKEEVKLMCLMNIKNKQQISILSFIIMRVQRDTIKMEKSFAKYPS